MINKVQDKVFVTAEGLQKLTNEYQHLTKVKRPKVAKRVSEARSLGDLSENAEYAAAREEQSFTEGRIKVLEDVLKRAEIIKKNQKNGVVALGCRVKVKIDGKEEEFYIVGEVEADPSQKRISYKSPLGKALIGKKVGDKIKVEAPAGELTYEIFAVE